MLIKLKKNTALRIAATAITAVLCTLVVLSAVFPLPVGYRLLSIGTSYPVLANPDWLTGWSYRKPITVTNANADYQTKVLIGESSGATGEEVDCGGHVAADFDDLRFTAADGETLLDYWIESITGTTPNCLATVWVQNNATPDTTLYMYYGGTETAVSNGANTFITFDDFERGNNGDAIGGDWTIATGDVDISTEQDIGNVAGFFGTRSMKLIGGAAANPDATIPRTAGTTYAIRFRIYKETASGWYMGHGNGIERIYFGFNAAENILYFNGGWIDTGSDGIADQWELVELNDINLATPKFDIWWNGVKVQDNADTWADASNNNIIELLATGGAGKDVWIDNFIVRKWAATEPTFAFGSEETGVSVPTVTTQSATNVAATSCTGNGNITDTGGEDCHTRGFCYKVGDSGDPTTSDSKVYDNGGGSYGTGTYNKSITGLTESTYYRVRAYAINTAGTGYGTTVQVTTLPGDPDNLTDTAHNGTSVDLEWTEGAGADKTMVRYRTDQYPTGASDGTQAYFDTSNTTTVGSLTYGQIYYFRAWAYNSTTTLFSAGTSDKSAYTDPNAPTAFTVTSRTSTSIALNWTNGTGADKTRVQYRTDQYPTTYSDGTQAYFDTGTSANVTSLSNGQIYYFRAWSYDTDSGYYDSYAQLTDYTLPGNPSSLNAANPTTSTIDVSWTKGTGGDKTMVRYKIGSYPSSTSDGTQLYFDTGTSQQATSLDDATTYYFRSWAYDSDSGYYSSGTSDDSETTLCEPTITNSPSSYGFGTVAIAGTAQTTINYFTITNTGNCAVDVTIQGTNLTGVSEEQTFFPLTPVEVTPVSEGSWQDVDVSAHVPVGATGVILHLVGNNSTSYAVGVRKNGSTDNRPQSIGLDQGWAMIGVDANRIFEAYIGISSIDIYLVGYTISGVVFFTNAYDKTPGVLDSWQNIDCHTEAPNAIGLIFEVQGINYVAMGLRNYGSSDNRTAGVYYGTLHSAVIGCSASQVCEGYTANVNAKFFLIGYITSGATFNTNATDLSLVATETWSDLTALPTSAAIAFVEVNDASGGGDGNYGLRKNGSSEDIYRACCKHHWGFIECDSSHIIEGKIANTNIDFFVIGYATKTVTNIIWVLNGAASPGENIYGLKAGLDDADDLFDVVVNTTANAFKSNLAEDATQAWGMKLWMPTALSGYDNNEMTATITLVASAA